MVRTVTLVWTDTGFHFSTSDGEQVIYNNGVFKSYLLDDDDWVFAENLFLLEEAQKEAFFLLGLTDSDSVA